MFGKQAVSSEAICNRIREEIIPILYQLVWNDEITFHNPHVVPCWEKKGCAKTDCLAHGNTEIPCWYRAGTYCCGTIQGDFVDKCGGCRQCDVFKESCPTLCEEVGEALNNLLYSLREEKRTSRKHLEKIEYLNKELLSAVENLDSRNREIRELVITDKLTGLYNRNYLITVLDDEILRSQRGNDPLTAMMIDLDDFKLINDTYGHAYGDKVLSTLGIMLQRTLRKCDRAFRYGGEEFVAVLSGTDMTMAWILAERVRKTYEKEPIAVETKDGVQKAIFHTMSIGLAAYRKGMTHGALLEQADAAVYKAKSEGKNKVNGFGID